MAVSTKQRIAEQCLLYLAGGRSPSGQKLHINEARIAIEQVLNKLLKTDYLSTNIGMGETIPNGAAVATYDDIVVSPYRKVSKCTLPAFPIKLPMGMGVWAIYDGKDLSAAFIPLQMGDIAMLVKEPVISSLLGQIGYEVNGMDVIFNKDITSGDGAINTVTIQLVVLDITQYSDTDILPIPSDMEWMCIQEVCRMYGVEPSPDKINDPTASTQQGVPINQQMMP